MITSREDNARLQSDFYRDQFHKMLHWLMGAVVVMFVLILAIIYTILFQPSVRYYANTASGRIMSMPPPERV